MKSSKLDRQDRRILMPFGIFLVLCMTVIVLIRAGLLETAQLKMRDRLLPTADEPASPIPRIPIQIGVYIENVYGFSPDDEVFSANGWIWLSWPNEAQQIFQTRHLPPENCLRFVNRINDWDFRLEPVDERESQLRDGRFYRKFRFSGQFYVHDLDFHRFPFQTVRLPLTFELAELDSGSETPNFSLVPDRETSGVGLYIDVLGYQTTAFNITSVNRQYATTFGHGEGRTGAIQSHQLAFTVTYHRSVNAALLTLFLPLVIVMALVLFAPMLSASHWEIRLSIPPMALLTLIFLQQGYKQTLPELPYVTFMDLIYNACYFATLILFGLFLWSSNRLYLAAEDEKPSVIDRLDTIDRRFQIGLVLFMVVLAWGNWIVLAARYP